MKSKTITKKTISITGAVIFLDIICFTKGRSVIEQHHIILSLHQFLRTLIPQEQLQDEANNSDILFSPTGDGVAIALIRTLYTGENIVKATEALLDWSYKNKVKIRIGLHKGELITFKDINNTIGFCGEAVNYAKRIMDLADDHILCSYSAFELIESYLRKKNWEPSFNKLYYVKHNNQVHIINIFKKINGNKCYGNETIPNKYLNAVFRYNLGNFTEPQDDIINARQINCIALTADGLVNKMIEYLEDNTIKMKIQWKKLEFILPIKEKLKLVNFDKSLTETLHNYDSAIESLKRLKSLCIERDIDMNCKTIRRLPNFGILGFDHDYKDNESKRYLSERKIRIVWYIWGNDAERAPFADFYHPSDDYLANSDYKLFINVIEYYKNLRPNQQI